MAEGDALPHGLTYCTMRRYTRSRDSVHSKQGATTPVKYVTFGGTGLRVSALCLGTMTFGLQCDEAQSNAIMDAASEGGIDFFDTADVYPLGGGAKTTGRTEEIVGQLAAAASGTISSSRRNAPA